MKKAFTLYEGHGRTWHAIARDPERPGHLIDTNEFVVESDGTALLTDPGGQEIFPAVFAGISAELDPRRIAHIFASHQDPDVISSLALWLTFNPEIRCYTSWLWSTFIPHFGGDDRTLVPIPDEGTSLKIGTAVLECIPAHFLHSPGNFHLYDREARILFTGDVGAALMPPDEHGLFVKNFDRHVANAGGFHRRWMGSNEAKQDWCERASKLAIDMLCPQHGAIYRGADVGRFIDWFAGIDVGVVRPPARAAA